MSELNDYWARKHAQLAKVYSGHCGLIALDIASILVRAGRIPHILRISGMPACVPGMTGNHPLKPKPYPGLTWGLHQVCTLDNIAYDPIFAEPEPLDTYPQRLFGQEVTITINQYLTHQVLRQAGAEIGMDGDTDCFPTS